MKSSAKALKEILQNVAKEQKWETHFRLDYYRNNWEEFMEAPLSKVVRPSRIYGNKLLIEVHDTYWKNEIIEHKESILHLINSAFKDYKIEDLFIK